MENYLSQPLTILKDFWLSSALTPSHLEMKKRFGFTGDVAGILLYDVATDGIPSLLESSGGPSPWSHLSPLHHRYTEVRSASKERRKLENTSYSLTERKSFPDSWKEIVGKHSMQPEKASYYTKQCLKNREQDRGRD